mgnify:CR=1 FL=1
MFISQIMKTEMKIGILMILLTCALCFQVQAQFLNIRINIPAGMMFSKNPSQKVFGGIAGNAGQDQIPITWIAMESMENLSFWIGIIGRHYHRIGLPYPQA